MFNNIDVRRGMGDDLSAKGASGAIPASILRRQLIRASAALLLALVPSCSQREGPSGDWSVYGSDKSSTKYSPVDQVTVSNASTLEVAWEWASIDQPILDSDTSLHANNNESTPLAVRGILYTSTSLSQVAAIDGVTGRTIWTYDPLSYRNGSPPNLGFVHRGVAYWEGDGGKRIVYATGDAHLVALDATTGKPIPTFADAPGPNDRVAPPN